MNSNKTISNKLNNTLGIGFDSPINFFRLKDISNNKF